MQQLAEEQKLALQAAAMLPEQQAATITTIKKRQFARFDALLDQASYGPDWLANPSVARLVADEIRLLAEVGVIVLAYCLLANHVHALLQLPEAATFSVARMMQRLKGRTALAANKLLGRQGQAFWQQESYDHVVRDGKELERIIAYVLNNPVKAGLVDDWTKWPHSYVG